MIEIIPKKIKKAPEWYNLGFYVAVALLIAVVLGYALLFYFERNALDNLQDLEERISQIGTKAEKTLEAEVLLSQKRVNDFVTLLQNHKNSSNFFAFLETTCHPKVWLTRVELHPGEATAVVTGETANFRNLGQQVFILREQALINSIELTDLSIGEGGETKFTFYLDLNPQLFNE